MVLRIDEPTAVILVRAWVERGPGGGLRARITRTGDPYSHEQIVTAAASPEDVVRVVGDWIDAFVAAARRGDEAVTPR